MDKVDNTYKEIERILKELGITDVRCGFYIGAGWLPIVEQALNKLVAAGWDKELHQVKQKFCGLRIYTGPLTREQEDIIVDAEKKCALACEDCGKPHGLTIPARGVALCQDCI